MKSVPYVPNPRKFINMFKSSTLDPTLEALPVQTGGSPTVFNTTEAVTHIDLQVKRRPRTSSIKRKSKPRKTAQLCRHQLPLPCLCRDPVNTDVTTKETEMTSQLYYHDTAGFMDATDPLLGSNGGLAERYSAFISGNEVDIEGPLLEDIFSTSHPLVNGVDIKIKLWPSKNTFRLQSAKEEYRLVITDIILKLCRLNVDYGLMTSHMEMMKSVTAKYPYIHSDIKT